MYLSCPLHGEISASWSQAVRAGSGPWDRLALRKEGSLAFLSSRTVFCLGMEKFYHRGNLLCAEPGSSHPQDLTDPKVLDRRPL